MDLLISISSFDCDYLHKVGAFSWQTRPQVMMNTDGSIHIRGHPYLKMGSRPVMMDDLDRYLSVSTLQYRIPLLLKKGYDMTTMMQYASEMMKKPSITMDVLLEMARYYNAEHVLLDLIDECTTRKKEWFEFSISRAGFSTMMAGSLLPIKHCLRSMMQDNVEHYMRGLMVDAKKIPLDKILSDATHSKLRIYI
jgi:hypothetical protein